MLLVSVASSSPAVAAPGTWLSRINTFRAQNGLGPLAEDPSTSVVAQTWTQTMAATNTLAHNPRLSEQVTTPWTRLGENVGYGADEASVFQAFVNSSAHRANLLGSYNAVGIGQVWSGGRLWTTHVFLLTSAVLPPPPAPVQQWTPQPFVVPGTNVVVSSPDAAAVRGSSRVDVVGRGTDNMVYLKTWNGSSWSGYASLGAPTGSGIKGDPAVVTWAPGRLDVFVRGVDDKLWQRFSANGGSTWSGWMKPVGDAGVLASGPDVAAWGVNRLDVFVRGTDGGIWQRSWNGVSWGTSWVGRGAPPRQATGDPTVASWAPGRLDVFVRGGDGKLWQTFGSYSSWSGWLMPPGTEAGTIAAPDAGGGALDAASWGAGHYSVFVRGTDNQVYETRHQGGWSPWARPVADDVRGGPGATSRGTGKLDVFVRAQDGALHQLALL